MQYST